MFSKVINIRKETDNIYIVEFFSDQTAGPNWLKFVKGTHGYWVPKGQVVT